MSKEGGPQGREIYPIQPSAGQFKFVGFGEPFREQEKQTIMQKNNPSLRSLSQTLRKNMTRHERHLWYDYLNRYPIRFVRQHPLSNYIADFYCARAKLVVELDGSQHYEPTEAAADAKRTAELRKLGIHVLRFPNNAVDRYFEGVCEAIDMTVQALMNGAPVPAFPVEAVMW